MSEELQAAMIDPPEAAPAPEPAGCQHRMSWWQWRTMALPTGSGPLALQRWFSGCLKCRSKFVMDGEETRPPGLWNLWLPIRFSRPK